MISCAEPVQPHGLRDGGKRCDRWPELDLIPGELGVNMHVARIPPGRKGVRFLCDVHTERLVRCSTIVVRHHLPRTSVHRIPDGRHDFSRGSSGERREGEQLPPVSGADCSVEGKLCGCAAGTAGIDCHENGLEKNREAIRVVNDKKKGDRRAWFHTPGNINHDFRLSPAYAAQPVSWVMGFCVEKHGRASRQSVSTLWETVLRIRTNRLGTTEAVPSAATTSATTSQGGITQKPPMTQRRNILGMRPSMVAAV